MTPEQKKTLRKFKGVIGAAQDAARNTLVTGCNDQGAYIQFGRDMSTYNLAEALMYAESYERDGYYAAGTVDKAIAAAVAAAGE